jgi:hypothetical protein
MIEQIRNTVQKARKEYYDDGWDTIQEWIGEGCPVYNNRQTWERGHLIFAEARYLVQVRNRTILPHKILPGQTYRSQYNKYDGEAYYWRTKEEFYKLMNKYDLFPEY